MLIAISQGNKTVFFMHFGFVNATDRPLACVVEPAFEAFPAGKLKGRKLFAKVFLGPRNSLAVRQKPDGPRGRAPQLHVPFFKGFCVT